jgi:catechol 2,3-dioxygenase-like lactoylglutathione lyase family enzyme
MKLEFSHTGLVVSDLGRSVEFYTQALGLSVRERYPDTGRGLEIVFVGNESSVVELLYYKDPGKRERVARGRYDHLAWYAEDLDKTLQELSAKGVYPEGEPVTVLDGRRIVFLTGPDGERIELVEKAI